MVTKPKTVKPAPKTATPPPRKNQPLTQKQLQQKVQSGTATDRQQNRLNFLQKQKQPKEGGGRRNPAYTLPGSGGQRFNLETPRGAIRGQRDQNQQFLDQQVQYNRPNEYNPFGSNEFFQDPETGQWSQRQGLSPEEQQRLDQQRGFDMGLGGVGQGAMGQLEGAWKDPYSLEGFGNDPRNMDFSADRSRIEAGLMADFDRRNTERFQKEEADFMQMMHSRGIPQGSELYTKELDALKRRQGDEREAARTSALELGGSELERSFGLGQSARKQAITEYEDVRDRPFKELSSVLNQIKGPMLPQFQPRSDMNVQNINIPEVALGYGDLREKQRQFDQQMALQRANAGRGGGGGGSREDDLAYRQSLLDMGYADWQRKQDYMRQFEREAPRTRPWDSFVQEGIKGLSIGGGLALGKEWGS